jgi:hypothetical protein
MRLLRILPVLALLAFPLAGCKTGAPPGAAAPAGPVPAALVQQTTLYEIVRHLYRWYWDEADIERAAETKEWVFWIRPLKEKLDPGDNSIYAEVLIPGVGTSVRLKKSDYTIEELKLDVKSADFHIKNVARIDLPPAPPRDCLVVRIDAEAMKQYLFRTRTQPDYPDAALFERMRGSLRRELLKEGSRFTNSPTGEQTVFIAPLSPVGNDVWVFWENQKLLIRFSSDVDLTNPAVWEHDALTVHVYDPYSQMVVSLDDAGGSNNFMTRNQLGRALYNCIILGQRVSVTPRP